MRDDEVDSGVGPEWLIDPRVDRGAAAARTSILSVRALFYGPDKIKRQQLDGGPVHVAQT